MTPISTIHKIKNSRIPIPMPSPPLKSYIFHTKEKQKWRDFKPKIFYVRKEKNLCEVINGGLDMWAWFVYTCVIIADSGLNGSHLHRCERGGGATIAVKNDNVYFGQVKMWVCAISHFGAQIQAKPNRIFHTFALQWNQIFKGTPTTTK